MPKIRDPEFVACHWHVMVDDGNRDNWFSIHPKSTLGPIASCHSDMTYEIAKDIAHTLREAANFLDERFHPRPPDCGNVVKFPERP